MTAEYGLQSKITSVDTILLVHPRKHYLYDRSVETVESLFEGLEQRFDASRIYSIVNDHPAIIQFGNLISESENDWEILSKKDAIELLTQGTNIMLGGGSFGLCHAIAFTELVLGFLYSERQLGDKLRILAPANYIYSGGRTIDEAIKKDKENVLNTFLRWYLHAGYQEIGFVKRADSFSYTFLFDEEVIVEHKSNSKKEFSLEVLSSI